MATKKVIVIGGGLAGFAASIEASKFAQVVLLDKEARIGGNSAKASSGINGVNTPAQLEAHIEDSVDLFRNDTLKSGAGLCQTDLVDILSSTSHSAIEFLSSFGIHLDAITQCGGHSRPRTHRAKPIPGGKATNIGFEIISTLNSHVTTNLKDKIQIITNAKVSSLLTHNGKVTGVSYTSGSDTIDLAADAVVLATGGYSADAKGFLEQYAPKIAHLSTTNGPWATGDGVRLAQHIGAGVTIMDKVQIHPTSFVDPNAPNASPKILAPEALRAVGGILVNQEGKRFVNELGLRDYVTNHIFEHCSKYNESGPIVCYLILNEQGVQEFGASVLGFYKSKGLIKVYSNVKEGAVGMNVKEENLRNTLKKYEESAKAGKDEFGKTLFPVVFKEDEPLHVMIITPSIHYTMGGVKINDKAQVLKEDNTVIEGLYGAGEVTGGVHGENRLAGNSLLECVIFGRIAGKNAAQ